MYPAINLMKNKSLVSINNNGLQTILNDFALCIRNLEEKRKNKQFNSRTQMEEKRTILKHAALEMLRGEPL